MKTKLLFASLLLSGASWAQTAVKPMVMTTPNEYYIIAASPNGKWACGVYADYGDERYGFLWNLESGEIELLNPAYPSLTYSVSDEGIVVGEYTDHTYRPNGAAVKLAGYWKDHKWNRLEMPTATVSASGASGISPDGHYIIGHVEEGGKYIGYVWKDGKIYKKLQDKNGVSMPYAISPDGQHVGGWVQDKNRQACIWDVSTGAYTTITDYESPWSSGRKFTPDGKTLLYFGGWQQDGERYGANALYDVATGTSSLVYPVNDQDGFDFFDISNKNTVMCENSELGCIYQDGKSSYAYQYLRDKGVNLADYHVFVNPDGPTDSDGQTLYQITRAATVSADDNVMGFQYYNDDKDEQGNYSISLQSMVVKFNQATTGLAPVSVKASQFSGLKSVLVSWKPNVAAEGVTGYYIYRDGVKVNTTPVDNESFVDANVPDGDHKYTVSAVYSGEESAQSQEVSVTVAAKGLSTPEGLFARQHGYNSAYVEWTAPVTNYGALTYFDADNSSVETFGLGLEGVSYETGIRFDETQTSAYQGQKITAVSFYPLEAQGGWKINLYTHDNTGKLQRLYSQNVTGNINYGMTNTVKLDTPQDIPSGDLIIATEVAVTTPSQSINALDYGHAQEGYTDLVRMSSEADFYSIGEQMQSLNYLYSATWPITATVSPVGADLVKDDVKNYNVYVDGKLNTSSETLSYVVNGLAEGSHTIGISSVYANGEESAANTATVNITPDETQLSGVDHVSVAQTSNTSINATWEAPADHDKVQVQYCYGNASTQGVTAPDNTIMVCALYPAKTFRGRDGYLIRSARFYPLSDATYTVYIYKNDVVVSQTEVDNYTLNQWNEVTLSEPVVIDSKSSYRLVIDCYDVAQDEPSIAVDNNNPVENYSDLYSIDNGESWNPLSSAAVWANWMIGINIENPNGTALPVSGYDVTIDGVKKNTEMLTTTSFAYDFGKEDAQEHTIQVDAYYTVKPTSVSGGVTRFYIGAAGISTGTIDRIEVRQGDNEITVAGDHVTSVDLISAAGATVASAKGNTVSVNGVNAGVYIVKAVVNGETITRKVLIEK